MRKDIYPEKSLTGNFADYSIIASLENIIYSLSHLECCEINPIERPDGSRDDKFQVVKSYLSRIRKQGELIARIKIKGEYAIIQRIK